MKLDLQEALVVKNARDFQLDKNGPVTAIAVLVVGEWCGRLADILVHISKAA